MEQDHIFVKLAEKHIRELAGFIFMKEAMYYNLIVTTWNRQARNLIFVNIQGVERRLQKKGT